MGVVAAILLILFGLGFWAWITSPQWFASLMDKYTEAGIQNSFFQESEKTNLMVQVHQITDDFRDGHITWSDLPKIVNFVSKSDFAPFGLSIIIESSIIHPSGLNDTEKQNAHKQLLRLQWAEINKVIDGETMDRLWAIVSMPNEKEGENNRRYKKDLSDEEIRQFFEEVRRTMDDHNVPENPFTEKPSVLLNNAITNYLSTKKEIKGL